MSIDNQSKRKITVKWLLILQIAVLIYTTSGIFAKLASGYAFLSWQFILFYGCEIFVLGVYAILWQQIIKNIDLSFAYANRSISLFWSMLWAFLLFGEEITYKNIIGVIIVVIGTMVINTDHE